MRGTSWWLSDRYFTEHPAKKAGRADEAKWGDKWRVYCTNCLAHHITEIQQKNDLDKIQNLIDKDDELITLRKSIKNASLAQLENGVITTNDYLREVNAEEQAVLNKISHEIQYLLTQYNLKANLNN